jgi:hypothetical protein
MCLRVPAGERIYYDWATLLRQLGIFHEPDRTLGRISTLLTHRLRWRKSLCAKSASGVDSAAAPLQSTVPTRAHTSS